MCPPPRFSISGTARCAANRNARALTFIVQSQPVTFCCERGAVEARSGIVDEDIQPVKLCRDRVKEQVDIFHFRQVGVHHQARRPKLAHLAGGLFRGSHVAVVINHHIRAGLRQAQRDRPANPAPRPGHQGDFACKRSFRVRFHVTVHVGHPFPSLSV